MRRRFGSLGPYPSDFTSDYQTDFKSDYRNWGSGKPQLSSEWVNEFKGLGTFGMEKGKLVCMALTLSVGIAIGYWLRHSEVIVLGA